MKEFISDNDDDDGSAIMSESEYEDLDENQPVESEVDISRDWSWLIESNLVNVSFYFLGFCVKLNRNCAKVLII